MIKFSLTISFDIPVDTIPFKMQPTHRVSLTSALITLLTIPILAADLSIVIPPTPPFFDNAASLPPSTHATLLSSSHNSSSSHKSLRTAHISRSNTITFSDLPSGSYLLDIFSHNYIFLPFRLDVADSHNSQVISEQLAVEENGQIYADQNLKKARDTRQTLEIYQTFRGNEWDNRGPKLASGVDSLNVNVHPVSRRHFFQKRSAGFDVLSFFKSPMILMGLVTCGLVFGMPYLMENSMFFVFVC